MKELFQICFAIVAMIACNKAIAVDYFRLVVDLDGDNKSEVITASIVGAGDFQEYSIRVGDSKSEGKFFAVYGDIPQISLMRLDYDSGKRLLMVTTNEPDACVYDLLSYTRGHLMHLLQTSSTECDPPKQYGNNRIAIHTWEGFWNRQDIYDLDPEGTKLTIEPRTIYPVGVPGSAIKLSAMQVATCRSASISYGTFVLVKDYDIVRKRYLVKSLGDACGWVPVEQMQNAIGELPWAN